MTSKVHNARNMSPEQARKVFTKATERMPPEQAKKIIQGAVSNARQARSQQMRRQQANQRFKESWDRGSGITR